MSSELSAVEYARLHQLSIDYLADPLPITHIEGLLEAVPEDLSEDPKTTYASLPLDFNARETLTIDKRGAELLQIAYSGSTTSKEVDDIVLPLLATLQHKLLRLELPLLRTDHDSDCRDFARWEVSHIRDGCLPWEPLDDELDVGLQWPTATKDLSTAILKELENEKIEMQKDTMILLQATVKASWTLEDDRQMQQCETLPKRNTKLKPMTPPLLPLSPLLIPYIVSSPACHLPFLSDPASLISEDLRKAEEAVFEGDHLIRPAQDGSPITDSPNTGSSSTYVILSDGILIKDALKEDEKFPMPLRIKTEDRKVEVPLMPAVPAPSLSKSVTFNDVIEEILLKELPPPILGSPEEGKFFQEAFGDAAANANRMIEQEQLQEADANNRVRVPIVNFKLPDPPWRFYNFMNSPNGVAETQKAIVSSIFEEYGRPTVCLGMNKLNTKLRWTVFPSELAKVALDEKFGDNEVVDNLVENTISQTVIDSSRLTWKPPGFRILKENPEDYEDDLELGHFEDKKDQDVASLVRKRKIQYEGEKADLNATKDNVTTALHAGLNLAQSKVVRSRVNKIITHGITPTGKASSNLFKESSMVEKRPAHDRPDEQNPLLDGPFSASKALDNFLEIRASKKQKLIRSAHFDELSIEDRSSKVLSLSDPIQPMPNVQWHKLQKPLPVPLTTVPSPPALFIISLTILKCRPLIRAINTFYPAAVLIERDFTAHNRTAWMPNSITRSPVKSSLDSEADFIISPSTGLILSTLQKIKQKPLPGQKARSAFKERIEKVSMRYERLVVLVSEACPDEQTCGLDESDTLALAEATGFCSSLQASVMLQFVGGGDATLAKWLVTIMGQYRSQEEPSVQLLEDETLWELFLRRAGMNAYAAQAVIAGLKAPEGVNVASGSKAGLFGISAFVEMSQEERTLRFERLLGGRRVLEKVGRVLDANWS